MNHAPDALSQPSKRVSEPQIAEILAEWDEDNKPEMSSQLRAISNEDR